MAFTKESLDKCKFIRGNKNIITGNHDQFPNDLYAKYFKVRQGIMKYKGIWLSHAPIHPSHLRDCPNIHGHLHSDCVNITHLNSFTGDYYETKDTRYLNVSVERCNGVPIELQLIKKLFSY